jgi:nucleoside 2-deoxyribosyltransferase
MTSKAQLYLAAPLFSAAERAFNASLKGKLSPYFQVFLPQEDGVLLADLVEHGADVDVASRLVFDHDCSAVRASDYLLILLDGRTIDEGAAFELGMAFTLGKRCIALQTDPRRMIMGRNNPMIAHAVETVFTDEAQLLGWALQESHTKKAATPKPTSLKF